MIFDIGGLNDPPSAEMRTLYFVVHNRRRNKGVAHAQIKDRKSESRGKTIMKNRILAIIISMLAWAVFIQNSLYAKVFNLDLRQPKASCTKRLLAAASSVSNDGVVRSFYLDVGAANVGNIVTGDELIFTLFDDVTMSLTLCRQQRSSPMERKSRW